MDGQAMAMVMAVRAGAKLITALPLWNKEYVFSLLPGKRQIYHVVLVPKEQKILAENAIAKWGQKSLVAAGFYSFKVLELDFVVPPRAKGKGKVHTWKHSEDSSKGI